jgi:hypothetical protein
MFQRSFVQQPVGAIDLNAANELVRKANPDERVGLCYCIGRFHDLHGNKAAAREYYQRAMSFVPEIRTYDRPPIANTWRTSCALAAVALKALGAAPKPDQKAVKPPRPPEEF